MNITKKYIIVLFIILVIIQFVPLISEYIYGHLTESFSTLGKYPDVVTNPILYKDYNVKQNPGLSKYSSSDIIRDYPIFPASSTQNNNIEYWRNPDNGTCSPADFCGSIYENTEQTIPPNPQQPTIGGVRVNFYDSSI